MGYVYPMSGLGIPFVWNTHSIIPVPSSLSLLRCLLMPPLRSPPGAPPIMPVSRPGHVFLMEQITTDVTVHNLSLLGI